MKFVRSHRGHHGFSLLELSIVLIVISVLLGGSMLILTQKTRISKQADMNARFAAVEKALIDFRKRNNRLPCPAKGSLLSTNANTGYEASVPGDCYSTGSIRTDFSDGSNTVGGVVPFRTLHLPEDALYDPWGNMIFYVVDKRMTATNAFTLYSSKTTTGSITVNDVSGTARTTKALAVVMSSGPNGHGAFQYGGARKSASSSNAGELLNCHCVASGVATTFTPIFVQRAYSMDGASPLNGFDDQVRFYTRGSFIGGKEQMTDIP